MKNTLDVTDHLDAIMEASKLEDPFMAISNYFGVQFSRMIAEKNSPNEMLARNSLLLALHHAGWSNKEIALKIGRQPKRVCKVLQSMKNIISPPEKGGEESAWPEPTYVGDVPPRWVEMAKNENARMREFFDPQFEG